MNTHLSCTLSARAACALYVLNTVRVFGVIAEFKTAGKKMVSYRAQHNIKFLAHVFAAIAIFTYFGLFCI